MMEPNPRMSLEHMLIAGFTMETIERHVRKWAILKVLEEEKWHQGRTAARLGVHRNTLIRWIGELRVNERVRRKKPCHTHPNLDEALNRYYGT